MARRLSRPVSGSVSACSWDCAIARIIPSRVPKRTSRPAFTSDPPKGLVTRVWRRSTTSRPFRSLCSLRSSAVSVWTDGSESVTRWPRSPTADCRQTGTRQRWLTGGVPGRRIHAAWPLGTDLKALRRSVSNARAVPHDRRHGAPRDSSPRRGSIVAGRCPRRPPALRSLFRLEMFRGRRDVGPRRNSL